MHQSNMSQLKHISVVFGLVSCIRLIYGESRIPAIDEDYFFASHLRTANADDCGSELHEFLCDLRCPKYHLCVKQECLCVEHKPENQVAVVQNEYSAKNLAKTQNKVKKVVRVYKNTKYAKTGKVPVVRKLKPMKRFLRTDSNPPGFVDLTKFNEEKDEYSLKPALRHHIAHFCPNLEVARTCIRTCMKVGKPAFCGKDHVCYCGHSYRPGTKDSPTDSQAMYAQFKDLYKKYFGDGYMPESDEKD